jgi:hypothetical protein
LLRLRFDGTNKTDILSCFSAAEEKPGKAKAVKTKVRGFSPCGLEPKVPETSGSMLMLNWELLDSMRLSCREVSPP